MLTADSSQRKFQISNSKSQTNSKFQIPNSKQELGTWNAGEARYLELGTWNPNWYISAGRKHENSR